MAVEDLTGTKYLDSLVRTNPDGATDPMSVIDDQTRGIKNVILNSFPNVNGAVNPTPTEFNLLVGKLSLAHLSANTFTAQQDIVYDGPTLVLQNSGTSHNGNVAFHEGATTFGELFGDLVNNKMQLRKYDAAGTSIVAALDLTEAGDLNISPGNLNVVTGTLKQAGVNVSTEAIHGFSATVSNNTPLTSTGWVNFDTTNFPIIVEWDTDSWFTASSGRFQPTKAGVYHIVVHVYMYSLTPDTNITLVLYKGVSTIYMSAEHMTSTATSSTLTCVLDVFMDGSTDYITTAFSAGGDNNWAVSSLSYFQARFIGI